jgi:integrase
MTSKNTIRKDPFFIDYCENRNIKDTTVEVYVIAFQKYTTLLNRTLPELIDEAELEEERAVRLRKRKIKQYLLAFKQHLDKENYSDNYKRNLTNCIRTFYTEYDIQLPKRFRNKSRNDRKQVLYEDLPTMQDISHILKYANLTYKAIILLGVSSGMSRAEICSLTFKDLFDAIPLDPYPETLKELVVRVGEIDNLIPLWKVQRQKTGNNFFTFSSPEASDRILDYLKDLDRRVIRYTKDTRIDLKFKFSPDTQLFVNKSLNPLTDFAMTTNFVRLNQKAGFELVDNRYPIRPHSLRKVFASTLEKNKMPHLMTRWLMGHTQDTTTTAYFKADPQAIREEYIQVLNHLTTNQVEIKLVETYQEIKQRLDATEQKFIEFAEGKLNAELDFSFRDQKP